MSSVYFCFKRGHRHIGVEFNEDDENSNLISCLIERNDIEREIANFKFPNDVDKITLEQFDPFIKPIINGLGRCYCQNQIEKNMMIIGCIKNIKKPKKTKNSIKLFNETVQKFKKSMSNAILLKCMNQECDDMTALVNNLCWYDEDEDEDDDIWDSKKNMAKTPENEKPSEFFQNLSVALAHIIVESALKDFRIKFNIN